MPQAGRVGPVKRYSKSIKFLLTPEFRRALDEAAARTGDSASSFLRHAAIEKFERMGIVLMPAQPVAAAPKKKPARR